MHRCASSVFIRSDMKYSKDVFAHHEKSPLELTPTLPEKVDQRLHDFDNSEAEMPRDVRQTLAEVWSKPWNLGVNYPDDWGDLWQAN